MRATIVAAVALAVAVGAANASEPPERPRIALVLSGGGARGAAHVGVLRELEAMHVPVDLVVGTSMGSIVGGLYAAGIPPEDLDSIFRTTDWTQVYPDRPSYADLTWRRKAEASRYLLDFELGYRAGRFRIPTGLSAGQKLSFELSSILLRAATDQISSTPIPYRAVATDLETGDRVVLERGELVHAMVASAAVPGVFTPVEIDGRLLVDGGMSQNLPVDVARDAGATIVIAVDVGTPLAKRERLGSLFSVLNQATTFLTRRNTLDSLTRADVVIAPELPEIGSSAFNLIGEAIERGSAAARAAAPELSRYALDEADWAEYLRRRRRGEPPPAAPVISEIRVEGAELVDPRVVLGRVRTPVGAPLDLAVLREDMARVFGLDDFQRVTFDVRPGPDGRVLTFDVREKPWGPTYIRFGIEVVDDLEGDAAYGARVGITRTRLNARGGEWRSELQLGSLQRAFTELYQPLDFHGRWFVAPWLSTERANQSIFLEGRKTAEYDVRWAGGGFDVGAQFGRFGEIRVGIARQKVEATVETGAADLPSFDVDSGGFRIAFAVGTIDRPAIPRTGFVFGVQGAFPRKAFGSDAQYDRVQFGGAKFVNRGRHTVFFGADAGTNLGSTLPVYDEFAIGGLLSLGGFSEGELRGQVFAVGRVGYHFRIATLPAGFGEGIYVGTTFEIGNTWESRSAASFNDVRHGTTVILGLDSFAGPVFLAYGVAEGGGDRFYLTVGRSF